MTQTDNKIGHSDLPKRINPMPERLYEFNPWGYCGVVMPESVMKKLVKLAHTHEQEIIKVLMDNKDKLYCQGWNLAYPNGEQVAVKFAHKGDIERRIKLFKTEQPEYLPEVYFGEPHSDFAKEVIVQIETKAATGGDR